MNCNGKGPIKGAMEQLKERYRTPAPMVLCFMNWPQFDTFIDSFEKIGNCLPRKPHRRVGLVCHYTLHEPLLSNILHSIFIRIVNGLRTMAMFIRKNVELAAKLRCPSCRTPMSKLCEGSRFWHCDRCDRDIEESPFINKF